MESTPRLFAAVRASVPAPKTPADANSEHIGAFLTYLTTERRLAPNTVHSYAFDLLQIARLLPCSLQSATRDQLRSALNRIQASGVQPRSIGRKLGTLRHFYQYLRRKRLISASPLRNIRSPKFLKPLLKPVSDTDFSKLIEACDPHAPDGLRDLALLRVLDSCGLRASELTQLTHDDLHLDQGHIIVRHGKGDKDRFAPIDKAAATALRRYLAKSWPALYSAAGKLPLLAENATRAEISRNADQIRWSKQKAIKQPDYIFPITRQRVWQIIGEMCKRAKIAPLHPHQLRHRLGTTLVEHGLELRDVADILGHSSTDTTEIYVGLDFSYLRKVFRKTHPRVTRHGKGNRKLHRSSKAGQRK